jgi:protein-tyrosine phosphatase
MNQTIKPAAPGCNLRDLTGRGRIFRSDALTGLGPEARTRVDGLGLRTVVDLRHDRERREFPCDLATAPGVDYRPIDLTGGISFEAIRDLGDLYVALLKEAAPRLSEAVRLVMGSEGPALFHCAAGKDRTGVVALLILGLLGADEATIEADYLATGPAIVPILPFLRAGLNVEQLGPGALGFLDTKPEFIRAALDTIRGFGGFEAYARTQMGWTDADIADLRHRQGK